MHWHLNSICSCWVTRTSQVRNIEKILSNPEVRGKPFNMWPPMRRLWSWWHRWSVGSCMMLYGASRSPKRVPCWLWDPFGCWPLRLQAIGSRHFVEGVWEKVRWTWGITLRRSLRCCPSSLWRSGRRLVRGDGIYISLRRSLRCCSSSLWRSGRKLVRGDGIYKVKTVKSRYKPRPVVAFDNVGLFWAADCQCGVTSNMGIWGIGDQ